MKLVLFDLDGTLIDSEIGIVTSIEYALEKLGAPIPSREELRKWIGPPLRATFPLALGGDAEKVERAVALYRERFQDIGWREHVVYPGIADALVALVRRGLRLAVVTSKPDLYAGRIVASLPFGAHFEQVYAVGAGSAHSEKASLIARALDEFGIAPDDAAMIGDRHFDIEGALANRVRAVGVTWGFGDRAELESAGAHAIAESPQQLLALVSARADAGIALH
jgi:phosphoglycolate phosphatase